MASLASRSDLATQAQEQASYEHCMGEATRGTPRLIWLAKGERRELPPASGPQPFNPVSAIPSIKYRWAKMNSTTTGSVTNVEAAIHLAQAVVYLATNC
jgi:hypothetical protein